MTAAHILVVDDEPDICQSLTEILIDEGYSVSTAGSGAEAREQRRARRPDLILLDVWMQDIDGISLLREWLEAGGLPCPVVVMSGHGTVETAVEATRLGAYDFLEKPISLAKLLLTVERALEADKLARENQGLRGQTHVVSEPIGKGPAMQRLREQILRVAGHDTNILLTGEPGCGKKTFARFLHAHSSRQSGPFVEVGVGSLAGQNSARELFGSEEAGKILYGRFEEAHGGTLFLLDVADMDAATQTHLVGAIEQGSFVRAGGSERIEVDVRVVAATQSDLTQAVAAGRFREDLYYLLNVVPIHVPPLRAHAEDVPDLLNYYVNFFTDRERLPFRRFAVAAQNRLRHYDWPGNIRELKNLVQRLLILGSGEEIGLQEVESALAAVPQRQPPQASAEGELLSGIPLELPLREARESFERSYLEHQLKACGGNVGRLAKQVGMERTHLYRKLRALDIDFKKIGGN